MTKPQEPQAVEGALRCSSVIDRSLLESMEGDALEAMESANSDDYRNFCSGEASAYRKLIDKLIRDTNRR